MPMGVGGAPMEARTAASPRCTSGRPPPLSQPPSDTSPRLVLRLFELELAIDTDTDTDTCALFVLAPFDTCELLPELDSLTIE